MKMVTLDINVEISNAKKNYGCMVDETHILDVTQNAEYLEAHRNEIMQQFAALALYDCSQLIFADIQRRLADGQAPITTN